MGDFIAAIGLVLVIEGIVYGGFPHLAKKLGVQMRIDVVRTATQQLMDTAAATQIVSSQFRAAVYTFGTTCTSLGLATIAVIIGIALILRGLFFIVSGWQLRKLTDVPAG